MTNRRTSKSVAGCLLALAAAAAHAQPPARPDPMDPAAAVPPLHHRPALAATPARPSGPATDWKAANDRVGAVGGWKAYAREAAAAPAADGAVRPATTPAAASPQPPRHGEHPKH